MMVGRSGAEDRCFSLYTFLFYFSTICIYLIKIRKITRQLSSFSSVLSFSPWLPHLSLHCWNGKHTDSEVPWSIVYNSIHFHMYLLPAYYLPGMGEMVMGKRDMVFIPVELVLIAKMNINKSLFKFGLLFLST